MPLEVEEGGEEEHTCMVEKKEEEVCRAPLLRPQKGRDLFSEKEILCVRK